MKTLLIVFACVFCAVCTWVVVTEVFLQQRDIHRAQRGNLSAPVTVEHKARSSHTVLLPVPYVPEVPEGTWTGPWKNGCEEASLTMVKSFYQGKSTLSTREAASDMQRYFDLQDRVWGSNANADAARMVEIISQSGDFVASVQEQPTIEDLEQELRAGYPVITLHFGRDLHNKNIPFLPSGSYYHVLVLVGFDPMAKEFIVHDDGDTKTGEHHRYGYDLFMASLHDYSFETKKADGPARVLFTRPLR